MCVIIVAWKVHPEFPLILIANRDEYFARDTLTAAPWSDAPHVFGGRDGERGGTWLGISNTGKLAVITNYRNGPLREDLVSPKSRGLLTADWLKGNTNTSSPEEYLKSIDADNFDGYNLLVGNVHSELWFSSNRADNGAVKQVEPGIHGVANQYMNAPNWPKVETAKKSIESLSTNANLDEDALIERLFDVLRNDKMYDKEELPDTGVDAEMERLFSSMFVKADEYDYGTRASTVILANKSGGVRFVEKTFDRDHKLEKRSEHRVSGVK